MKKIYICISLLGLSTLNAQDLKKNTNEILKEYDAYVSELDAKNPVTARIKIVSEEAEDEKASLRKRVAFMFAGRPYYYQNFDQGQINSSDADAIQDGKLSSLSTPFLGEGMEVYVFDGGRIFQGHDAFISNPSRVINKENEFTVPYSLHATAVASIIGGDTYNFQSNTIPRTSRSFIPKANLIGYSFYNTVLPGESQESSVFDKIKKDYPYLSNHSYGINQGWGYEDASSTNAGAGWYYYGYYNPTTKLNYDLQGVYIDDDGAYDEIIYNNPHMVLIKSAGNSAFDGPKSGESAYYFAKGKGVNNWVKFTLTDQLPAPNCANGFDCIGTGSLAKNIIVVGATLQLTTPDQRYVDQNSVLNSNYSSRGPRDDGGIKPDISAVGTGVMFAGTEEDYTGSSDFYSGNGTSFSAPAITGIMGLWMQIHKSLFSNTNLDAASAKALLIHSAKDAGTLPGPDADFGWGFANAKSGAELLVAKSQGNTIFENRTKENGKEISYNVLAGSSPIKATISWVDPAFNQTSTSFIYLHNLRQSMLINDMDLRIIDSETGLEYFPFKLDPANPSAQAITGDNTVDNVEQVLLSNPVEGRKYIVKISNKGTLKNAQNLESPQNLSVIISGYQQVLGVEEMQQRKKISVVPTVTEDLISVLNADTSEITVYDLSGKKVSAHQSKGTAVISLGGLPKGVYIININSNGNMLSEKVILK